MASTPTPSFFDSIFETVATRLNPPAWIVSEIHQRVVLLVNHVLMQEPQAQQRLVRQKGQLIEAKWRTFSLRLAVTPAGLFEVADAPRAADLLLLVDQDSPASLVQAVAQGNKPPIRIQGDVQLAAEINWLVDHVRWDITEDLSRILGDAPAHALVGTVKKAVEALRSFAASPASSAGRAGTTASTAKTVPAPSLTGNQPTPPQEAP